MIWTLILMAVSTAPDAPEASIRAERASYVQGEPIGMLVTIRNPGPRAIEVVTHYPNEPVLKLEPAGGGAPKRRPVEWGAYSGPPLERTIESGASWDLTLYWPLTVEPPAPGPQRLRASCHVAWRDADKRERLYLRAIGEVAFDVTPRDADRLASIYDRYAKAEADEDRDDPWPSETAHAALDSVRDPAVIPWLARLLDHAALLSDGYVPIDKFRDIEAARLALTKLVRTGDPERTPWALGRLGEWGHHLAVEDIRPFLASADVWLRSRALGYLKKVRDDRYRALRPEVARLAEADATADAMPALAVLGIWAEAKGPVPGRLTRAVAGLDAAKDDDVRLVLDAAAVWRHDIGGPTLRRLLATPKLASANGYEVAAYAEAMGRADYQDLARQAQGTDPAPAK